MRPELRSTIEDAYAVFAAYGIDGGLIVCNCNVCMDLETERVLARTPLRELSSSLLAEYTNSAHGYDEDIAVQLKHFLPRYFELIAQADPPDQMGCLDQCLRRLGEASYRTSWPAAEAEVIDRFFDEFLIDSTALVDLDLWPVGWRTAFDIIDALTLALTAGADVERLIAAFERAPDPGAAIHLAALRQHIEQTVEGHVLHSAYLEDSEYEPAAKRLGNWIASPDVGRRIEAAFFLIDDPRHQEILSKGAW